jgi:hypothetical protein
MKEGWGKSLLVEHFSMCKAVGWIFGTTEKKKERKKIMKKKN